MKERLLQYIWQFQHFNKSDLATIGGEPLQIIHPGNYNTNQGSDFTEARIKINNTTWAGNIEIHIRSSDWDVHHHSSDTNYSNIILHAVWKHDKEVRDISGKTLPTLELQGRVSKILLARYEELMKGTSFIPCEKQINTVSELTLLSWKHRLLAERLENRSQAVFSFLHQNNFHWEESFWWMIAKNFGIKINGDSFEKVARSVPIGILAKHKNQVHHLEALLFGQAGLLENDFTEAYPAMLKKEYIFLRKKYLLQNPEVKIHFLRMRPANFPTIRLAQLAILISKSSHLFSRILETASVTEVRKLLEVTANDYWHYHYIFDETSPFKRKKLGSQMIDNILINTVVPVLFAYGLYHNNEDHKSKAIAWLEEISCEKNAITRGFESLAIANKNSFDSQSLIHLKNSYCNEKRCLECAIGNALLKMPVGAAM